MYVFLLTLFIAHSKLSKSSCLSLNTRNGEQLDITSPRAAANKETKPFQDSNSNYQLHNRFERFSSWTCNAPKLNVLGSTLLVIKPSTKIQKYLYMISVVGGVSRPLFCNANLNDVNSIQIWIYYEERNSWKMIDNVANVPSAIVDSGLVTHCSSLAIIVSS